MAIATVQVSPLMSSIVPCECGHPQGRHDREDEVGRLEDDWICWGHNPNGTACLCPEFREAA